MREFILYSRKGRTDGNISSLRKAGRLDVVYQCLLFALFTSGSIRRDVIFHAILGGPPQPPIHLTVDGRVVFDVRTDEETWKEILRTVLSKRSHPGITLNRESLQQLAAEKTNLFVLEEKGTHISKVEFGVDPAFILGDQIGLPKKDESYLLRHGKKISIGKKPYLAATCIDILNYVIDERSY